MTEIRFAIPVKPKSVSTNWELVLDNLRSTLNSVLRSTSPDFRILIATHDQLDIQTDPRIDILTVDFAHQEEVKRGIRDKQAKLRFIAAHLRAQAFDGYIMLLDADDLVSKDLVGHVHQTDNKRGYLLRQGYRLDVLSGDVGLQISGFDKSCGSCFVGYFKTDELPVDADDRKNYFSLFLRHTECFVEASNYGREPEILPFPGAVYITNHADSLRMARLDGQARGVLGWQVIPPAEADKVLLDQFGFVLPRSGQADGAADSAAT